MKDEILNTLESLYDIFVEQNKNHSRRLVSAQIERNWLREIGKIVAKEKTKTGELVCILESLTRATGIDEINEVIRSAHRVLAESRRDN